MLQAVIGYIVGQTVVILAIAFWHLLKRWDCPCREELAGIESLGPPQPCRRQSLSLHRADGEMDARYEPERAEP